MEVPLSAVTRPQSENAVVAEETERDSVPFCGCGCVGAVVKVSAVILLASASA